MATKGSDPAPLWKACILLVSTVTLSLGPGFLVLGAFNEVYPDHPNSTNIQYIIEYALKAFLNLSLGFCAMMVYSNVAFPIVMGAFARILSNAGQPLIKEKSVEVVKEDNNNNMLDENKNLQTSVQSKRRTSRRQRKSVRNNKMSAAH